MHTYYGILLRILCNLSAHSAQIIINIEIEQN